MPTLSPTAKLPSLPDGTWRTAGEVAVNIYAGGQPIAVLATLLVVLERRFDPMSANGFSRVVVTKRQYERTTLSNCFFDGGQSERRFVTRLAVPNLRHPEGVWILWIIRDDVAQATGHVADSC